MTDENPDCLGPCSSTLSAAPIRKRRFSSAKIQPTRVKRVMQSDDEIGRMVASVPVAIGRAMEHFAEKLLEAAAQCVQYSTSRTLSPSHIKQAVMQNPHFMFLEPLMREIPLPSSAGAEMQWRTDWLEQPSFSGYHPASVMDQTYQMGVPIQPSQTGSPKMPVCGNLLGSKRRQSNGELDETKPKRGRPRKIKKEDKCVDDDGLLLDERSMGCAKGKQRTSSSSLSSNGSTLTDRELMPPPSILPIRALTAAAVSAESKQDSPLPVHPASMINSINNGGQGQQLSLDVPHCMQSSSALSSTPTALQIANDPENNAASFERTQ